MMSGPERYNVSTVLDVNLEHGREHKTAIFCYEEHLTYGQLFKRVCAFARALRALGVRREERILMILDDTPAFPIVFLGAMRAGVVPVPVNPFYKSDDFAYFLEDSYARLVIADFSLSEKARAAIHMISERPLLVLTHDEASDALSLEALITTHEGEFPPANTHAEDMAFWAYSSGSTGRPKGVVHTHRSILYSCQTYARHVLRITANDITFSTSKLFHTYGLGNNLIFPYWAGATTVLHPGRPTPEAVFQVIRRYRPTLFFSVPTLYNSLLHHPHAKDADLSSLRLCISAAEPLPAHVYHRWWETFGLTILDGLGSTEMFHIFCSNREGEVRPGSSGKPVPGYEIKVVTPDGRSAAVGEIGHLYVRGGSAFSYYWHNVEKTRHTLHGEWVFTGDCYLVDEEGFLWYQGRSDDMLKVGGLWVSPIEIEEVLTAHPAVLEAAVVGVQREGFTRIQAFVVLKPGLDPSDELKEELQQWCKSRLQRHKYPHLVEFVSELPKTVTGKIQRFKLRASPPPSEPS